MKRVDFISITYMFVANYLFPMQILHGDNFFVRDQFIRNPGLRTSTFKKLEGWNPGYLRDCQCQLKRKVNRNNVYGMYCIRNYNIYQSFNDRYIIANTSNNSEIRKLLRTLSARGATF